jgi:hypothetical protein
MLPANTHRESKSPTTMTTPNKTIPILVETDPILLSIDSILFARPASDLVIRLSTAGMMPPIFSDTVRPNSSNVPRKLPISCLTQ